ncbi:unnamed protein product [Camellia sinensis]
MQHDRVLARIHIHRTSTQCHRIVLGRRDHTTTQMGSGHFSCKDYRKASLFRDIGAVDDLFTRRDPGFLEQFLTNRACYDLRIGGNKRSDFYYEGLDILRNVDDIQLIH